MAISTLRLGFMGFGESAELFATDLSRAGITSIAAYSPSGAKAKPGDPICLRAQNAGVTLVNTPRALAKRADIIFALTQGKTALAAARKIVRSLEPHHIYIDGSTNSAAAMEKIAALIGDRAQFVDAAIMAPVAIARLKTPIVASGPRAGAFRDALAPFGMDIKVVSDAPGAASAMKLIRSVFMKGLAALLFESMEAAHRRGMLDVCAEDISATFDAIPFRRILKRYICSTPAHAARRVHEMKESLEMLQSIDSRDRMTRATAAFIKEFASSGLDKQFPKEADSVREVLDAWIAAKA
jgi:3-hydroxyisobutyrate dehydrogenase-like beta-hydroxyacid dehydrogenase